MTASIWFLYKILLKFPICYIEVTTFLRFNNFIKDMSRISWGRSYLGIGLMTLSLTLFILEYIFEYIFGSDLLIGQQTLLLYINYRWHKYDVFGELDLDFTWDSVLFSAPSIYKWWVYFPFDFFYRNLKTNIIREICQHLVLDRSLLDMLNGLLA